ncbi:MAG: TIGR01777 family oxidoreductase [Streptosporangiaceae bacterium]|nr:TIGR01777 family protein [Actinomycetota bacterium]
MRVVVTGSAGLIGTALTESLRQDGAEVVRLVRGQPASPAEIRWDPLAPRGGLDPAVLSGADAVVHLAGAPIASGRWTEARKHELRASRVTSTEGLVAAMTAAAVPPLVLLAGSAIGWYGDTGDREVDESAPAGTGFLAALVRDWEAAAAAAGAAGVRVVNLRSGIVLSRRGGMLARLAPVFRLGLGARLGAGDQYISWISLTDEVRAIRFLQDQAGISGPVNLTAPEPVTNAELTAALASAVGRPALLRVPAGLLRAGLGEVSSELLAGARVRPARLRQAGFEFRHPELRAALGAELAASR